MQPDNLTAHAAALDLQRHHGLYKFLRFFDLGGTITPPSDDPQDWWEPENLTHRAELLGICTSGPDGHAALSAWMAIAANTPPSAGADHSPGSLQAQVA
ncbi:hypothetical protein [Pseudophaeobacter leonis]|uniref:hypothetical protein n=1 Tax=Pseudophaeobacter leonis TaxID=1144477 RepID=UPI0009F72F5D|nr:hypothetical protein [Pseudophaeobacter leonis]